MADATGDKLVSRLFGHLGNWDGVFFIDVATTVSSSPTVSSCVLGQPLSLLALSLTRLHLMLCVQARVATGMKTSMHSSLSYQSSCEASGSQPNTHCVCHLQLLTRWRLPCDTVTP